MWAKGSTRTGKSTNWRLGGTINDARTTTSNDRGAVSSAVRGLDSNNGRATTNLT